MSEIPKAPIARIIKEAGAERVSEDAKAELAAYVEEVAREVAKEATQVAKIAKRKTIKADDIKWTKDVSKVSIVGAGMVNNAGVATTMFEALYNARVNINMISTSEVKVSVLIEEKDAERAVKVIHDKFNFV